MSASDDTRLGNRVPAVLRIRLTYSDVDTFVEKFSGNVSRGGLFIATKQPLAVGTVLRFEFQLKQGTPVVKGEGEVIWVKPFDAAAPTKPHGMGVRFTRLDPDSRSVIDRALAWKERGKPAPAEPPPPPPAPDHAQVAAAPPPPPAPVAVPVPVPVPVAVPAPVAAHANGADVDQLAAEFGITAEQIAATIAKVRAQRPDLDEIEQLLRGQ
jgi:uncharacterized protein (TIGR02266 family)